MNYAQCWRKFLFSDVEYLIKQAVRNLKTHNHILEWKQLGH